MLAREYINRISVSAHLAILELGKPEDELTERDYQKALAKLDEVKHDLEAAQCLLREGIY